MTSQRAFAPFGLACLLALGGCQGGGSNANPPATPPDVGFVTVQPRALAVIRELPGRVAPTRIAEVRARVGGLIVRRFFEQGTHVNQGDPLYQIDPDTFRAELESAQAEIERQEASLTLARQQAERNKSLLERQVGTSANYETAFASLKQAEAQLAGAKAAHTRASLNLEYTTVRAPIAGRIGRALLTEGTLVDQGSTQRLATIQQLDPVYVDITQSVGELRKLRRDLASGELARIAPNVATVKLVFEDGSPYAQSGRLLFSEVTADPSTGQVTLRVEIANPNNDLFPGMYVRARIEQAIDHDAIAVPVQAIQRNLDGKPEIYVVRDDDTVDLRSVELGDGTGGLVVVRTGLRSGERAVVDGFQRIGRGSKVQPVQMDEKKFVSGPQTPGPGETSVRPAEAAAQPADGPARPAEAAAGR